jgi:hypothetical protein
VAGRRNKGQILLDLGKLDWIIIFTLPVFIIFGISPIIINRGSASSNYDIAIGILFVLFGVTLALTGCLNTLVTETGIYHSSGGIKWNKIKNYLWVGVGQTQNNLFITNKGWPSFLNIMIIQVPAQYIDQVTEIMKQYVPNSAAIEDATANIH